MRRSKLLVGSAIAVYLFLYIPLAVVVVFSFNDSKLSAEWVGFTTSWYTKLFHNAEMLKAATNSLFIAVVASLAATVLGTMAGIAMHRYRSKLLPFMVLTPIAMPEILLGVSLLIFFITTFGEEALSLLTVIVAHTTFCIGFVAIINEFVAAFSISSLWNSFVYQLVVNPTHSADSFESLKLNITTTTSGT